MVLRENKAPAIPFGAKILRRLIYPYQSVRGIPRLAYVTRHWLLGRAKTRLVQTPEGLPITINLDDVGQVMHFYFPYCTELQSLFRDLLLTGDVCLDLGANSGVLSIVMADCVEETGLVIAIDPNPKNIAQIQHTIDICHIDMMQAHEAAIAGQDGFATFSLPANGRSESGEIHDLVTEGSTTRTVTVKTLADEFLAGRSFDFVKYDVEGVEAELIATLQTIFDLGHRPMLLVEFHPHKIAARGGDHQYVRQTLRGLGYMERHVITQGHSYQLVQDETPLQTNANILYLTREQLAKRPRLQQSWLGQNDV